MQTQGVFSSSPFATKQEVAKIENVINATFTDGLTPNVRLGGNLSIGGQTNNVTGTARGRVDCGGGSGNRTVIVYQGFSSNSDHGYMGLGVNSGAMRYQVDDVTSSHVFYAAINSSSSRELMRINGGGAGGPPLVTIPGNLTVNGTISSSSLTTGPISSSSLTTGPIYQTTSSYLFTFGSYFNGSANSGTEPSFAIGFQQIGNVAFACIPSFTILNGTVTTSTVTGESGTFNVSNLTANGTRTQPYTCIVNGSKEVGTMSLTGGTFTYTRPDGGFTSFHASATILFPAAVFSYALD
jgi:hypothetical protein